MRKDIERGNIAAKAARRHYAYDHAVALIPHVEQARRDLTLIGKEKSNGALADWLNRRDLKTINGKTFRRETVNRLLNETERTMGKAAIEECDTEIAIVAFEFAELSAEAQTEQAEADNAAIQTFKARCLKVLAESVAVGRRLRGERRIEGEELTEMAVALEASLRSEMRAAASPPTLYARRVVSRSHERRKRPDIAVRKERAKRREQMVAQEPQLGLE